ncbi:DAZ-associated protein 1 isoform X3 [Bombina bombina]|uniref:DAZ-associated protein 1 isoform X3 n=1 Tax=Bombina bombina TaxID=8345 RepID=UPI00235B0881|nr:DAZ-associated protein 1 isoform X3 [Bombina bombina]
MNNQGADEIGKLFVGGLDWSTTQETLRSYFSKYGEVVDCVIMKDKTTNQSRGFGFVKFNDPDCVDKVLASKPHSLDGRNIDPKPCTPRGMQPERTRLREGWQQKGTRTENNKSTKIFVGGIPHNCGETELKEYFNQFGTVTEVVMIYDAEKQRPRGFGFITFEDEQSVDQAVNMHFHDIMGKKVEVKRAEPRDSKSQTLGSGSNQWAGRSMQTTANGWTGQQPPTWQQSYSPQGMWMPGQTIGGYGSPAGRGAPPPPPPSFTSFLVSPSPGGFPPTQGFTTGYATPPPYGYGYGPAPPEQFVTSAVPPPPATPGAAPLAFPPPPPGQQAQDLGKTPSGQPDFPFSQFGYGQDMSGYGQSFSDLSQQPPSYTPGPSAPASGGLSTGGSGLGRGQNHNVQGFHPYRR